MKKIYLSLGSNLGDREQMLQLAVNRLPSEGIRVLRNSSVYETEPLDVPHQPWFLNLVVEAETDLFPMQVLARALKIERDLGRRRVLEKGPRAIDVDILLFERFVIETAALAIPHPRMSERRFVLEPLAELAPDLRHPVSRRTIRELLAGVAAQQVRRTEYRARIQD